MFDKKGFTLLELLVVLVILGILAVVAVPTYTTTLMQGAAKAAQNNLITIYNAEKNYYFNNNSYCSTSSSTSSACSTYTNCAKDINAINCNLSLNITDNDFTYTCTKTGGFKCTAKNNSDSKLKLTLTNASIILPGGTGCTASPWDSPCNPSCSSTNNPAYCPS